MAAALVPAKAPVKVLAADLVPAKAPVKVLAADLVPVEVLEAALATALAPVKEQVVNLAQEVVRVPEKVEQMLIGQILAGLLRMVFCLLVVQVQFLIAYTIQVLGKVVWMK